MDQTGEAMIHARMLRYLDEVARQGSIRQAAVRLNVSSSSINRQIIDLETRLGLPLFERLPRGLRLTAAGELLLDHVRQTLRAQDRVMNRIAELEGVGRGDIRIATMNGLASGFLPKLCRTFASRYPGAHFLIHNRSGEAIVAEVLSGAVDIGLGYNLRGSGPRQVVQSSNARLGVVLHPGHPLAGRISLTLSELTGERVILASGEISIRPVIDAACRAAGVMLSPPVETNSVQLMKYFVVAGEGISFLSLPDVAAEVDDGSLVFVPLRDVLPDNPLLVLRRETSLLSPIATVFMRDLCAGLRTILPG